MGKFWLRIFKRRQIKWVENYRKEIQKVEDQLTPMRSLRDKLVEVTEARTETDREINQILVQIRKLEAAGKLGNAFLRLLAADGPSKFDLDLDQSSFSDILGLFPELLLRDIQGLPSHQGPINYRANFLPKVISSKGPKKYNFIREPGLEHDVVIMEYSREQPTISEVAEFLSIPPNAVKNVKFNFSKNNQGFVIVLVERDYSAIVVNYFAKQTTIQLERL